MVSRQHFALAWGRHHERPRGCFFFKCKYRMYLACKFQWKDKNLLLLSSLYLSLILINCKIFAENVLFISGATLSMRPAPIPIEDPEWRQTPPPVSATSGTFRLRRGSRFTWRKECLAVMERYTCPFP